MLSFRNSARLLPLGLLALSACSDQSPTATQTLTEPRQAYTAPAEPVNGEFIRVTGTDPVYLVFGRTLYGMPDMHTLRACTGGREQVVRQVASLPAWPQKSFPSAGDPARWPHGNSWIFGDRPIQSDAGGAAYVLVGCVKSGITGHPTYQALYGDLDFSRIVTVPDPLFRMIPEGPLAGAVPFRRAGTLIESGWVKWVTYHGGALGVSDPATMDSYCRPWSDLVVSAGEHAFYAQSSVIQPGPASGCLRGNDYPFQSKSYGTYRTAYDVDPWQFWYRECTSFAAWRLNQDGIEFHNGYGGTTWSHAYKWDEVARNLQTNYPGLGVRINKTAKRGAIAQWDWGSGQGHVAYVAIVHNDNTITVEEYNQAYTGLYRSIPRRIPITDVHNFIHFR